MYTRYLAPQPDKFTTSLYLRVTLRVPTTLEARLSDCITGNLGPYIFCTPWMPLICTSASVSSLRQSKVRSFQRLYVWYGGMFRSITLRGMQCKNRSDVFSPAAITAECGKEQREKEAVAGRSRSISREWRPVSFRVPTLLYADDEGLFLPAVRVDSSPTKGRTSRRRERRALEESYTVK